MFSTLSLMFQDIQCSPQQFQQLLISGRYADCNIVFSHEFWSDVCKKHMLSFYVEKIYLLIVHGLNIRPMFQAHEELVETLAELYSYQKQILYQSAETIRLMQCYKFIFKYIMMPSISTVQADMQQQQSEEEDKPIKRQRVCF